MSGVEKLTRAAKHVKNNLSSHADAHDQHSYYLDPSKMKLSPLSSGGGDPTSSSSESPNEDMRQKATATKRRESLKESNSGCNGSNGYNGSGSRSEKRHQMDFGRKLGAFCDVDISEPASSITNSDDAMNAADSANNSAPNSSMTASDVAAASANASAKHNATVLKTNKEIRYQNRGRNKTLSNKQLKDLYSMSKTKPKNDLHFSSKTEDSNPKEVCVDKSEQGGSSGSDPISSLSASGRSSSSSSDDISISSLQAVYHFETNESSDHDEDNKRKSNNNKPKRVQISFPEGYSHNKSSSKRRSNGNGNNKAVGNKKDKKRKNSCVSSSNADKPKRPLSAYNYFFRDERARIVQGKKQEEQAQKGQGRDNGTHLSHTASNDAQQRNSHDLEDQLKDRRNAVSMGSGTYNGVAEGGDLQSKSNHKNKTRGSGPGQPHHKISFGSLGKLIATRWKTLANVERTKYQEMAEQDTRRYRLEMDVYYERENAKRRAIYFPEIAAKAPPVSSVPMGSSIGGYPSSSMTGTEEMSASANSSRKSARELKLEAAEILAARKNARRGTAPFHDSGTKNHARDHISVQGQVSNFVIRQQEQAAMDADNQARNPQLDALDSSHQQQSDTAKLQMHQNQNQDQNNTNLMAQQSCNNLNGMPQHHLQQQGQQSHYLTQLAPDSLQQLLVIQGLLNQISALNQSNGDTNQPQPALQGQNQHQGTPCANLTMNQMLSQLLPVLLPAILQHNHEQGQIQAPVPAAGPTIQQPHTQICTKQPPSSAPAQQQTPMSITSCNATQMFPSQIQSSFNNLNGNTMLGNHQRASGNVNVVAPHMGGNTIKNNQSQHASQGGNNTAFQQMASLFAQGPQNNHN